MRNVAPTAFVDNGVRLGETVVIEDYCIVGCSPGAEEPPVTTIGNGALIRSFTVIYAGNQIGENFQTGNTVNIRETT